MEGLCQKVYLNYIISSKQMRQDTIEDTHKPEVDFVEEAQRLRLD